MNIIDLNTDCFYEIIPYLLLRDFMSLSLTCTKFYDLTHNSIFWKYYSQRIFRVNCMLKDQFKLLYGHWDWNLDVMPYDIKIYPKNIIHREGREEYNPSSRTQRPFNPLIPCIKFKIIHRGEWIGLGVVDSFFQLKNAQTIGRQSRRFNCGYFSQETIEIQAENYATINEINLHHIQDGDIMTIYLDYPKNRVSFEINGIIQGAITFNFNLGKEELYPCVNLSVSSSVQIYKDI